MKANKQEIAEFLKKDFPQSPCIVEEVVDDYVLVRHPIDERHLRPGGTVSGPTMFFAADLCLYAAVLAELGIVPLAVTSQLSISFLRKPKAGVDIFAKARLLKKGRTLLYGEVFVYSEAEEDPIAHVTGTYVAPPTKG